jgi:hypothetical protein
MDDDKNGRPRVNFAELDQLSGASKFKAVRITPLTRYRFVRYGGYTSFFFD